MDLAKKRGADIAQVPGRCVVMDRGEGGWFLTEHGTMPIEAPELLSIATSTGRDGMPVAGPPHHSSANFPSGFFHRQTSRFA